MHPYKKKYNVSLTIFVFSTVILILCVTDMYSKRTVSKLDEISLSLSFVGLIISIPLYAYYKARRDEVKRQEQYDAEMLGVLGQQNLDEEDQNKQGPKT